jgi:shikimate dehydrogenase
MKFGLIGYPLTHSFSKEYFTSKFQTLGLEDFSYDNFPLTAIEEVIPLLQQDFMGFNVTIPYKEQILKFLHDSDPAVTSIGAANTLVHIGDHKWKAYNTDASGFQESLLKWFGSESFPAKALVLGTGGASKAVVYTLQQLGIEVSLVSSHFKGLYTYAELNRQVIEDHLLIINTTPVGQYPHIEQCPAIPFAALTPDHWLFDLVYNPGNTLFLTRGEQAGARIKNGLEMLHLQADHAWSIWKSYGKF